MIVWMTVSSCNCASPLRLGLDLERAKGNAMNCKWYRSIETTRYSAYVYSAMTTTLHMTWRDRTNYPTLVEVIIFENVAVGFDRSKTISYPCAQNRGQDQWSICQQRSKYSWTLSNPFRCISTLFFLNHRAGQSDNIKTVTSLKIDCRFDRKGILHFHSSTLLLHPLRIYDLSFLKVSSVRTELQISWYKYRPRMRMQLQHPRGICEPNEVRTNELFRQEDKDYSNLDIKRILHTIVLHFL